MNPQHKFMLQQAFQEFKSKNYSHTERVLKKILQSNLRDFDALHLMAINYAAQEKHEEALKYYERTLEISPRDLSVLSNYGSSLSEVGLNLEALKVFQNALKIDSNDPDINYNIANTLCELEKYDEALEFYDHVITINPSYLEAYLNYGKALFDLSRYQEAIALYDKALELEPNYLESMVNKGEALKELKRYEEALDCEKKVLLLEPTFAEVWSNVGNILRELGRYDEALIHCEKAVSLKSNYAKGWFNKGLLFHDLKRFDEAISFYDKALKLDPSYVEALSNKGVTLNELKRCDEAIVCYDKAIKLKPKYHDAVWNKGLALLLKGKLEEGFQLYESRWDSKKVSEIVGGRFVDRPLWLGGQSLFGKTILLSKEQGFGDFIQFCRYTQLIADLGAKVILETPKALAELMKNLDGATEIVLEGEELPISDYRCPIMSLPLALGTNLSTIPFPAGYLSLKNHSDKIKEWDLRLGRKSKPRVGLAWSGNPHHKNDINRSIALSELIQFLPDQFEYISLQKELRKSDQLVLESNTFILNYANHLKDFLDTAALISNLDLVVSVDTSVAHLSGALGKKTNLLISYVPDWRWLLDREDSPWYKSIKLYRQPSLGDWRGALKKMNLDLNSEVF